VPSKDATPASPPKLRFPNTTQTVQFTGWAGCPPPYRLGRRGLGYCEQCATVRAD